MSTPAWEARDDQAVADLADGIVRVERNWTVLTSGPGSPFEGQRLEVAQIRWVLKRLREIGWQP